MAKTDRIGLIIVVASLLAISAIVYLLFQNQQEQRIADVRSQGVSLARALSGIPYEQLTMGGQQQGVIQVLRHDLNDSSLAYVSVVAADGRVATEVVSDGIIVPAAPLPTEPAAWLGDRQLELAADQRRIIEFYAPLFNESELQGFVRLGYVYPSAGVSLEQMPFVAMVALPVFLLAPIFYLLLRREIRPIRQANREISNLIDGQGFQRIEVSASGELGEFMQRFNRFLEFAHTKINHLEEDNVRLITSSKLLTYRKNRIETVLETLPEAVVILDEVGNITFANEKLAAMFGVSQEDIVSQPPQKWCDHADILNLLAGFQTPGKARNFTETIRFKSGPTSEKAIATKTYPLFSPKSPSSAVGTLIVFRDETQDALAREARVDFVAHLSHELKSPLNVLALYSESLLGEAGNSKEFRIEAANVIATEVDRLNTLISGLLSMTQIESGSLTPEKSLVRLRDVANAAFEEAKHMAGDNNFKFELNAPQEMNPVHVDKDLIRIALTNLLSNAIKYNSEGGDVRLTIDETDDAIQIRVEDSGIGVSEQDEERIFEKFYRSEDDSVQSIGGHGLGLALARQIVELHHGTLSLNRDRERGAEFIINFWKESTAVRQAI